MERQVEHMALIHNTRQDYLYKFLIKIPFYGILTIEEREYV